MKYSQPVGVLLCLLLIANCFLPWSYVADIHLLITGVNGGETLGKPGLFNMILCVIMISFFLIPKLWAKRANVIVGALNIAWSLRNYIFVGACSGGICPDKKAGIYLLLLLSFLIEIATFLPQVNMTQKDQDL